MSKIDHKPTGRRYLRLRLLLLLVLAAALLATVTVVRSATARAKRTNRRIRGRRRPVGILANLFMFHPYPGDVAGEPESTSAPWPRPLIMLSWG